LLAVTLWEILIGTTSSGILYLLSSFMTCHRVCNSINTTGATSEAGTAYPSGLSEFTPGF
jgi:hypothetical protein